MELSILANIALLLGLLLIGPIEEINMLTVLVSCSFIGVNYGVVFVNSLTRANACLTNEGYADNLKRYTVVIGNKKSLMIK